MAAFDAERAPPEELGLCPKRLERVRALARGFVDDGRHPCSQVLVGRRGKVALFDSYGWADKERGARIRDDAIFRIFSMTKPVTCVAAMICYERGCFQLDDPVSRWIPEWAAARVLTGGTADAPETAAPGRPVNVLHLFTHTAGIVSAIFSDPATEGVAARLWRRALTPPPRTLADLAARAAAAPLVAEPGAEWHYADGHSVLARLVEVWSGQAFDAFVADHVCGPLGMVDTAFTVPVAKQHRLLANYAYHPVEKMVPLAKHPLGKFINDDVLRGQPGPLSGSHGLVSTMRDFWRFSQMLANKGEYGGVRVLGRKTVEFMTMNHLPGNCDLDAMGQKSFTETTMEGVGFGLGMAVCIDQPRRKLLASPGEFFWGGAASTVFWVDPQEELVVVFLTQLVPSGATPVRPQLRVAVNQAVVDSARRPAVPPARM